MGNHEMNSRRAYLFIFLLALMLRLGFLAWNWDTTPNWNIDALGYHQLAVNLLQHRVFSLNTEPPFEPDSIRTTGYPLFLALVYALVGVAPRAVILLQALLDALTTLLVVDGTLRLSHNSKASILAGILHAIFPLAWRYAAELYVESFLAFWIALSFWLLIRTVQASGRGRLWTALALGMSAGVSLLVKPNVILLPIFLALPLLTHRLYRQMLAFVAALILILTPWLVRNAMEFGHFTLSTTFMHNLARISAPATMAQARGEYVAPWTSRWDDLFYEIVDDTTKNNPALFAIPQEELTPEQLYQRQAALANTAKTIIRAHPRAFFLSYLRGAMKGWMPQEQWFWYERIAGKRWAETFPNGIISYLLTEGRRSPPLLALTLFVIFLIWQFLRVFLAAWGAIKLFPHNRALVIAMVLFILYVTMLPGPIAYDRFHVPITPLLHGFMAVGMMDFLTRPKSFVMRGA